MSNSITEEFYNGRQEEIRWNRFLEVTRVNIVILTFELDLLTPSIVVVARSPPTVKAV